MSDASRAKEGRGGRREGRREGREGRRRGGGEENIQAVPLRCISLFYMST